MGYLGVGQDLFEDADNVPFTQAGTGAVARTAQDKLRETISVKDFGAVGDGVANDTTALQNFFAAAIASGHGHIPKGTYLVTEGALALDNAHVDTAFPNITTDGHENVIFLAANSANAPLLAISNGTAASGSGKFWRGGALGGITFKDTSGATAANRHGLSLKGVWGARFGYIKGDGLRADCVHITQALFSGTNPDPYMVGLCDFAVIESTSCSGWALNNNNYVGFTGNHIGILRVTNSGAGGWHGFGANNSLDVASMGSCSGWAFDDGTTAPTGGASSRFTVGAAELDNVENGVRANQLQMFDFRQVRFIHRFQTTPNAAANYWPRKVTDLAGGTSPAVAQGRVDLIHRIEAGGVLADLGVFVECNNNVNIANVDIDHRVIDGAALGVTDADLFDNLNVNAPGLVIRNSGRRIADTAKRVGCFVNSATSEVVPNTGFGTAAAKIVFATERYDGSSYYNTGTSEFTAPISGMYHLDGNIHLNVAAGTRIRLAFFRDRGGVLAGLAYREYRSPSANIVAYPISADVDVVSGDKIFLMADQNTAGAVNLSAPLSAASDNHWSAFLITP